MQMQKSEYVSKYFVLEFWKCCQLGLPAEIKEQTGKNDETCKGRCKLCHVNQTGQTTT